MIYLYQHHDLTRLAEVLAVLRGQTRDVSPLVPDTILVPNRGTGRWLQAELAESEGTAANLDLPVPGLFVWRMLRDTRRDRPDSSDYERGRLVWHLYALLPELDVPEVQRYLAPEPRERHRYQLAQQLADVFDQYLIHRRDVLAVWEAGDETMTPPASWQAPVWRAVVERIGQAHRAQLLTEFLERAQRGELDLSRVPDPIYAFALSDLPADYLRLLYGLGEYVDVHFMLPNPSAAYWGDVPTQRIGRVDVEALHAGIARAGDGASDDDGGAGQDRPTTNRYCFHFFDLPWRAWRLGEIPNFAGSTDHIRSIARSPDNRWASRRYVRAFWASCSGWWRCRPRPGRRWSG